MPRVLRGIQKASSDQFVNPRNQTSGGTSSSSGGTKASSGTYSPPSPAQDDLGPALKEPREHGSVAPAIPGPSQGDSLRPSSGGQGKKDVVTLPRDTSAGLPNVHTEVKENLLVMESTHQVLPDEGVTLLTINSDTGTGEGLVLTDEEIDGALEEKSADIPSTSWATSRNMWIAGGTIGTLLLIALVVYYMKNKED